MHSEIPSPPVPGPSSTPGGAGRRSGFTLVELLAVIAVMLLMIGLVVPSLSGMKKSQEVTAAAYDIAGVLEQARAYAMANHTYAWVGLAEVNASKDASVKPQTAGVGRVAVMAVASKDGTRHYAVTTSNQGSDWQAAYAQSSSPEYQGRHLVAISRLQYFDNIHLAATLGVPPESGSMARPAVSATSLLGDSSCLSETPFTYPLGSNLASNYQYRFDKVIEFNSEGVARIAFKENGDAIVQWMEIDLQPTHGNTAPPPPANSQVGNHVALQVGGMTGATRIYQP